MTEINWSEFEAKENYVKVVAGISKRLRFSGVEQIPQTFQDKKTGMMKTIQSLVFTVTEEDGEPVKIKKELTVTSKAFVKAIKPFVESGEYKTKVIEINKTGEGFKVGFFIRAI